MAGRASGGGRAKRAGWALAALLCAALCLVAWREAPPAPRGTDAPLGEFSAVRAAATWDALPGASSPHHSGSPAHAALGAALTAHLAELGLEARRDAALHARERADGLRIVAPVANIVALLRGTGPADAPLFVLSTHYDSVASGPGASDAGIGCAALLECARALVERAKQGERLPHDVLFLFSDGEEVDLVGAARFAAHDPLAPRVGLILNLEARGTSGLARVFRASGPRAELLDFYARCAPRPSTTSFALEVFRRLPNDTDVSVYQTQGMSALDAAIIGGVARYHTPLDDAEHRDPSALQHHGETALALAAGWRGEGAVRAAPGAMDEDSLAFGDVLGLHVVRLGGGSVLPLALLALAACAFCARRAAGLAVASALATLVAACLAALACTGLVALLAWWHDDHEPWLAHSWAWTVGLGALAYGLGALCARRAGLWAAARGAGGVRGGAGQFEQLAGAVGLWSSGAALIAVASPGAAAPFLAVATTSTLALTCLPTRWAGLILPCLGILLVAPLLLGIAEAFGQGLPAALAVPWALLGALAAPRFEGVPRALCWTLALGGVAGAALLPSRDAHTPLAHSASYWRSFQASFEGTWNSGPIPRTLSAAARATSAPAAEALWAEQASAQLVPPTLGDERTFTFSAPEHAVQWSMALPVAGTVEVRTGELAWSGEAREVWIVGHFQSPVQVVIPPGPGPLSVWARAVLGDWGWPWRLAQAVPRGGGDQVATEFPMRP